MATGLDDSVTARLETDSTCGESLLADRPTQEAMLSSNSTTNSKYAGTSTQSLTPNKRISTTGSYEGLWIAECLALLTSVACVIAIAVLLTLHDGQPLSEWVFYFTLNTALAVIGTTAKACLLLAVTASIGQVKWNVFRQQSSDLSFFDLVDRASRGPLGNLELLFTRPKSWSLLLGACIMVLCIGFEAMLQAIISTSGSLDVTPFSSNATVGGASHIFGGTVYSMNNAISREDDNNTYHGTYVSVDSGVAAAINGAFQAYDGKYNIQPLLTSCSTDVSKQLIKSSKEAFYQWSSSPGGPLAAAEGILTTYSLPYANLTLSNMEGVASGAADFISGDTIIRPDKTATFQGYETLLTAFPIITTDLEYQNGTKSWNKTIVTATECGLYLCLKAYQSNMTMGVLEERLLATTTKRKQDSWSITPDNWPSEVNNATTLGTPEWNPINNYGVMMRNDFQLDPKDLNLSSIDPQQEFNASQSLLGSTVDYLMGLIKPQANYRSAAIHQGVLLMPGWADTQFGPIVKALYNSSNIAEPFESMANSLTIYFRNSNSKAQVGKTYTWVIRYRIRWAFFSYPVTLVAAAIVFLALVVHETQHRNMPSWKTNSIAILAFGLDNPARKQLRHQLRTTTLDKAGKIRVFMSEDHNGVELSLLDVAQHLGKDSMSSFDNIPPVESRPSHLAAPNAGQTGDYQVVPSDPEMACNSVYAPSSITLQEGASVSDSTEA
ncbi:hypothetical protein C1H76_0772 [Elsinoe australis]|uniref:Uncharacterized protein n=1 Tax=Elsinoe australis TaxID=40998 RepID=A0A4U7BFS9_9PEZI|nr:hypothetical protein C1H76_0772 [Elsinoe australis]